MKKFASIIAMSLCICLNACSYFNSSKVPSINPAPSDYIQTFDYNSLSDFKKAIIHEKELYTELLRKNVNNEIIDEFKTFITKYQSQNIIVPHLNGKEIELRNEEDSPNISICPSERYGLTCVFFFPNVSTGENFYIRMAYLPDDIVRGQECPIASEVIKEISPNSPNINNLGEQHKNIYNQSIKLENREVTALVIEYKTDNRNSIYFVYDDLLVEIRSNPEVWSVQWFSALSFESYNE